MGSQVKLWFLIISTKPNTVIFSSYSLYARSEYSQPGRFFIERVKKKKNTKFKKKNHPQFVDQANDDKLDNGHNDFNFNRGKFHKKQHEF